VFGLDGDVCGRCFDQEGQGDHRGVVRDIVLQEPCVSSLAGSLDSELEGWRNRRLEAEAYPYAFVDARYEKVRMDHRIVSQGVLIVSAVGEADGLREILAVEVADTESLGPPTRSFSAL
jgi:transposase-like protein